MLWVQADALGQENAKLRGYIEQLEWEQRSLSMDLVGWQSRWKSSAANNVRLYHQLTSLQQRTSPQSGAMSHHSMVSIAACLKNQQC